jgi:hypothetical protein
MCRLSTIEGRAAVSDKAAYEVEGIRPDGETFTVEILGYQTRDQASALAQHYADRWKSAVRLYRVPFLNTSSTPWAKDEVELVNQFTSERP